jgi:hypothetical protein
MNGFQTTFKGCQDGTETLGKDLKWDMNDTDMMTSLVTVSEESSLTTKKNSMTATSGRSLFMATTTV